MIEAAAKGLEPWGVRASVVRNGRSIYVHFGKLDWFYELFAEYQRYCGDGGDIALCEMREQQFASWIGDDLTERRVNLLEDQNFHTALKAMLLLDADEFSAALTHVPNGEDDKIPF